MGHLLKYSVSLVCTPPTFVSRNVGVILNTRKVKYPDDCHGFLCWTCTGETSGACLNNKPRDTEETCIVSGDRGQLHISSCSQSASNNNLAVTSKRGYKSSCVYVLVSAINDGAKPKAHSQRHLIRSIYMRKNTYIYKNLSVEVRAKGAYFRELTVHTYMYYEKVLTLRALI